MDSLGMSVNAILICYELNSRSLLHHVASLSVSRVCLRRLDESSIVRPVPSKNRRSREAILQMPITIVLLPSIAKGAGHNSSASSDCADARIASRSFGAKSGIFLAGLSASEINRLFSQTIRTTPVPNRRFD